MQNTLKLVKIQLVRPTIPSSIEKVSNLDLKLQIAASQKTSEPLFQPETQNKHSITQLPTMPLKTSIYENSSSSGLIELLPRQPSLKAVDSICIFKSTRVRSFLSNQENQAHNHISQLQEWRNQEIYLSSSLSEFLSKSGDNSGEAIIPHLKNQSLEISPPTNNIERSNLGKRLRNETEDFLIDNESISDQAPSTDNRQNFSSDSKAIIAQLSETRHQLEEDHIQRQIEGARIRKDKE